MEYLNVEMIRKVDYIRNYKDNLVTGRFNESNKTALNIRVKEGYKNKFSGNLSLLSAYESKYSSKVNLFKFSPKFNLGIILGGINSGEELMNIEDYMNLSTGIKSDIGIKSSYFSGFGGEMPQFLAGDENVTKKEAQLGAVNFAYYPVSKVKISGFTILNHIDQNKKVISEREYLGLGNQDFNTLDSLRMKSRSLFGQSKFTVEYIPGENNVLNYSFILEPVKNKNKKNTRSFVGSFGDFFKEDDDVNKIKLGHQLNFTKRLAKNKLFKLGLYQEFVTQKTDYLVSSSQFLFDYNRESLDQNKKYIARETGIMSGYYYKTGKYLLNLAGGYLWKNNTFHNNILGLNSKSYVNYHTDYAFVRPSFEIKERFMEYSFAVEYRGYDLSGNVNKNKTDYFLPSAKIKFVFSQLHGLSFMYEKDISYPVSSTLMDHNVLVDYRSRYVASLVGKNKELVKNTIGLEYFYIDLFSDMSIVFVSSYSKADNYVVSNSNAIEQFNNLNNLNSPHQQSWNNFFTFEKKISYIKSKLYFNLGYDKMNGFSYIDNVEDPMQNHNYNYQVGLRSNMKKVLINYDAGIQQVISKTKYDNLGADLKNSILKPYINLNFLFSETLKGELKNAFEMSKTGNIKKNFYNLGFKLTYKEKKSPWKFWVEGNDILNISGSEITETSAENNILQRIVYSRLPGFAGVGASYNF